MLNVFLWWLIWGVVGEGEQRWVEKYLRFTFFYDWASFGMDTFIMECHGTYCKWSYRNSDRMWCCIESRGPKEWGLSEISLPHSYWFNGKNAPLLLKMSSSARLNSVIRDVYPQEIRLRKKQRKEDRWTAAATAEASKCWTISRIWRRWEYEYEFGELIWDKSFIHLKFIHNNAENILSESSCMERI